MPLEVIVTDTSADADALAGTDLEVIPEPGLLRIWVASTVNTATVTATLPTQNFSRTSAIRLRANGVPVIDEDTPVLESAVDAGEKPTINLGGTTGTIFTIARFTTLAELAAGLS